MKLRKIVLLTTLAIATNGYASNASTSSTPPNTSSKQASTQDVYAIVETAIDQENYTKALVMLQKLVHKGEAKAQYLLGELYFSGRGISQNYVEAAKWVQKAAEQNHAAAQFNLGFMYEEGRGVKQSNSEAVKWYQKAAEQDYAAAQFFLGVRYMTGRGVKKNDSEGVKWL